MNFSAITGLANSATNTAKSKNVADMDQNDFLRLMTKQLEHQDPFNTVDNTEMVAQMAQFSSLAGVSKTNATLESISELMSAQIQLLKDIKAATLAPTPTTQEG